MDPLEWLFGITIHVSPTQCTTQYLCGPCWGVSHLPAVVLWDDAGPHRADIAPATSPTYRLGQHQGLRQLPRWRREVGREWSGWRPLLLWFWWVIPLDWRPFHTRQPHCELTMRSVRNSVIGISCILLYSVYSDDSSITTIISTCVA